MTADATPDDSGATITVRVLLFARLAEAAGASEQSLTLARGATTGDVLAAMAARVPEVARLAGSIAFAIDDAWARGDATVADGQCVALIPPVSGG